MSYFVYLLRCADDSLYCGYTNNLKKRIQTHNNSKQSAKYTRSRRPVKLVYYESYLTKSDALSREANIKKLSKDYKEELVSSFDLPARV